MLRLLVILLLISAASFGQTEDTAKYIWQPKQYGLKLPRIEATKVLRTPYGDTAEKPQKPGALMMHTNKTVYKWNGTAWVSAEGAGGGGSTDSSIFSTNYRRDTAIANVRSQIVTKQYYSQTSTVTVSNSSAENTIIGTGAGSLSIPSTAWVAGKTYEVIVYGILGTDASNPANFNFRFYLNSTAVAITGALFQGANVTGRNFELRMRITCRSAGSSGTVMSMGMYYDRNGSNNRIDNNGTGATTTINTTNAQTLGVTVQMNQAAANNTVSIYSLYMEEVN